eukprot:scaffold78977_cov61-Phaeocystis_antarctica.AAC.1
MPPGEAPGLAVVLAHPRVAPVRRRLDQQELDARVDAARALVPRRRAKVSVEPGDAAAHARLRDGAGLAVGGHDDVYARVDAVHRPVGRRVLGLRVGEPRAAIALCERSAVLVLVELGLLGAAPQPVMVNVFDLVHVVRQCGGGYHQ